MRTIPNKLFRFGLFPLTLPAFGDIAGESGGWTGGNLLGFLIQVGLFILAAAGIWKLAGGGGGEGGDER